MAKGKPTTQAKRAIEQLLAAGFERKEFKVTTKKHYRRNPDGSRFYEWGDALISLRVSLERALERTPAMLEQELHVKHYSWIAEGEDTRRVRMVLVDTSYDKRGKLSTYSI